MRGVPCLIASSYRANTLSSSFEVPNSVFFETNGKKTTNIHLKNSIGSEVEISLEGANILSWKTSDGKERIWSDNGKNESGISLSFPQYGRAVLEGFNNLPRDGFARMMKWEISKTMLRDRYYDRRPTVILQLKDTENSRLEWPHEFNLEYKISLSLNQKYGNPSKKIDSKQINSDWLKLLDTEIEQYILAFEEGSIQIKKNSFFSIGILNLFSTNLRDLVNVRERLSIHDRSIEGLSHDSSLKIAKVTDPSPLEGIIAKRRRLEKERGQPAYFKYKITHEKRICPSETFINLGYPEDLNLSLNIYNQGKTPFKFTFGLQSNFAKQLNKINYSKITGLGLLPFLEHSSADPKLNSDTTHEILSDGNSLDRMYADTSIPNELFFSPGDQTYIQVIEQEGLNNIHLWYPKEIAKYSNRMKFIGFSPCQAISPINLENGEKWEAIVTFRWLPMLLRRPISSETTTSVINENRDIDNFIAASSVSSSIG